MKSQTFSMPFFKHLFQR